MKKETKDVNTKGKVKAVEMCGTGFRPGRHSYRKKVQKLRL